MNSLSCWLRTQSAANWSARANSLLTGKITGNFADSAACRSRSTSGRPANSVACDEIPCAMEQGILRRLLGKLFEEQGIFVLPSKIILARLSRQAKPSSTTAISVRPSWPTFSDLLGNHTDEVFGTHNAEKITSRARFCLASRCLTENVSRRRISLTTGSRVHCPLDPQLLPSRRSASNIDVMCHFRKWPGHSMKRTFVGSSPELTTTSCATADVRGGSTNAASSTQHRTVCAIELVDPSIFFIRYFSKAKIRFQSFFMLMTNQPSFFAWSYSA